ncbi:VOC family protein [Vibrio sp. 99-8-1]|uniref:VOC family protein n=1 Tax=Vibrio sp. 99-8-1 TaxID=2607602 RepID=UPI0014935CD1|nr:VOC family protein [Vibrio sp. 99-8-1]NOI67360.1 lactoylglutathione lyase [Vibrio sp. 99-8-1]
MSQQISITIDVEDLTKAIEFYVQALSCELKSKNSQDWAVLSLAGIDINLLEKKEGTIAAAAHKRSYERHWTPVHLDLNVENLDNSMALVKQYGGKVEEHISSENSAFAHCADPFGNGFCMVS